ncbi:MAG: UDP-N-acetylmuramoyl-tripeptide--D-alanyl-D-alanine ligase [Xanthomonadales bacterium]|nr:UDP-N-acetylmuramoyl-tripeptide--D-alanyl-D-alanine ligase [Xanthomonadales bacterium]
MLKLKLSDVALWTHGTLRGGDAPVHSVAIDTRQLKADDLFVALPGEHSDGHDHLDAAQAAGATAALVSRWIDVDLAQIKVPDTLLALGDLASAVRAQQHARVIGITGSNGKTTVKSLAAAILARHGRTHVSQGNHNNEIGVPLTLLAMPEDTQYAVIEMGAGKPGDIDYLAAMARPDIGLITNIASAHLGRMGSIDMIAETKGAMLRALPADCVAVIPADDAFAAYFTGLAGSRKLLRFGFAANADVSADAVQLDVSGSRFVLRTPSGRIDVALPLSGRHNVINALAAAAVAEALSVPLTTIAEALHHAQAVGGRQCAQVTAGGWTVIDDSYNANPASLAAGLASLALHPGERWLVLGDMAELGADEARLHGEAGEHARQAGIEHLFAVGPLSANAVVAFGTGAEHFADQGALITALRARLHAGVVCLVKGSRSAGMEHVVAGLGGNTGESTHAV